VAQEHSKKYKHLKMSVLRETFEIEYAVALTFTLIQSYCSVPRDEKQPIPVKVYQKTAVFLT
jgi:hypothetical protein